MNNSIVNYTLCHAPDHGGSDCGDISECCLPVSFCTCETSLHSSRFSQTVFTLCSLRSVVYSREKSLV